MCIYIYSSSTGPGVRLFKQPYYERVKEALRPGGIHCAQDARGKKERKERKKGRRREREGGREKGWEVEGKKGGGEGRERAARSMTDRGGAG